MSTRKIETVIEIETVTEIETVIETVIDDTMAETMSMMPMLGAEPQLTVEAQVAKVDHRDSVETSSKLKINGKLSRIDYVAMKTFPLRKRMSILAMTSGGGRYQEVALT